VILIIILVLYLTGYLSPKRTAPIEHTQRVLLYEYPHYKGNVIEVDAPGVILLSKYCSFDHSSYCSFLPQSLSISEESDEYEILLRGQITDMDGLCDASYKKFPCSGSYADLFNEYGFGIELRDRDLGALIIRRKYGKHYTSRHNPIHDNSNYIS
jgi:hypothetical protein